jgi:HK97 family phage portal protein
VRIPFTSFDLSLRKSIPSSLQSIFDTNSWVRIFESFPGAWQTNTEISLTNVLTYAPVFACIRLISWDISKMRLRVVEQQPSGIWTETFSPAYSPVLRKPNRYQTQLKFIQQWVVSLLVHGNTYVLKQRDQRGVVNALYVLDPTRVRVLEAPDGSVFYALQPNFLGQLQDAVTVPASEIIQDTYISFQHPLAGVGPLSACGLGSIEALRIQESSANFFANNSMPGGVITGNGHITQETADRIKAKWDEGFSGPNAGKVGVLGDGFKFDGFTTKAVDAQLIEQLKWTAENVATAFGVPLYKISVGPYPTIAGNIEALDRQYYSQTLQTLVVHIEDLIDFGLGMAPNLIEGRRIGSEFDREDLMQMDTAGRVSAASESVKGGVLSPNEARLRWLDAPPVSGGDSPMMQQQQFSLAALGERDAAKPFSKPASPPDATPAVPQEDLPAEPEAASIDPEQAAFWLQKALGELDPMVTL